MVVKNIKRCVYCGEDLDISTTSFIHSPLANEYRHLSCYTYSVMYRVKNGISEGLREYQKEQARLEEEKSGLIKH
jgi:hypothetical protein